MMWIALVAVAVYAALKSAQLAFLGQAAGYSKEPISLGRRLRKGEPALLIVAAIVTMPPAIAATWYHTHKFQTVLGESIRCYGLIRANHLVPEISHSNGEYAVYESLSGYRWTALDAGRQLGQNGGAVQRQLDQAASALTADRQHAGKSNRQDRLSATQECLHPPKDLPNA